MDGGGGAPAVAARTVVHNVDQIEQVGESCLAVAIPLQATTTNAAPAAKTTVAVDDDIVAVDNVVAIEIAKNFFSRGTAKQTTASAALRGRRNGALGYRIATAVGGRAGRLSPVRLPHQLPARIRQAAAAAAAAQVSLLYTTPRQSVGLVRHSPLCKPV